MRMGYFAALALVGAVACDTNNSDTGDTSGTTTGTPGANVDSCQTDQNLCYEFTDFSGTSAFCDELTANYGWSVTYQSGGCTDTDSIYECDLPGVGTGGASNEPAVAYYYTGYDDPAGSCSSAGGTEHQ